MLRADSWGCRVVSNVESRSLCARGFAAGVLLAGIVMPVNARNPAGAVKVPATKTYTVAEARRFAEMADRRLLDLWIKQQRAQWIQETFITDDTEQVSAEASQ